MTPPSKWLEVELQDIASTGLGKMLSKKSKTGVASQPYLRNRNIQWGWFDLSDVAEMDFLEEELDRFRLRSGDLLICEGGEVGRAAVWKGQLTECYYQKALHRVRPYPGISSDYLRYLFEHLAKSGQLEQHVTGSTIRHLPQEDLRLLRVPLPSTDEQKRIVAVIEKHFSHLDAGLETLHRVRRTVERLRALSFSPLLSDERWPWTTLGEIAEVVGGVTKDSKRQSDPSLVEVPYLRVANVQRGHLDLREVTTIRVGPEKAKTLELQWGDILFNEGGDRDKLGRGWVWEGQVEHCIHQNHVFRARLIDGRFDSKFISMHGNSFGQRWFERMGKQTTNLASINLKTLKAFPVPAPSLEDQRNAVAELERRLTILDSTLRTLDEAERRAQGLRRSILTEAFAGKLVPQDPTDEPASLLLDRISRARNKTRTTRPRQRAVGARNE